MDYVDWVEKVLNGMADAWRSADDNQKSMLGISFGDVTKAMGFPTKNEIGRATLPARAVLAAMQELVSIGLLEKQSDVRYYKLTQNGRLALQMGLSFMWDSIVRTFLEPQQLEVLTKLVEIGQEDHNTYVMLRDCPIVTLGASLGGEWHDVQGIRVYRVLKELEAIGSVKVGGAIGAKLVQPTYAGCVRATRQVVTEWQAIIRSVLPDWETTNVEFKQEVNLKTPTEKAEFVKDMLALATTKSSGRRFLVIGFHKDTHQFVKSVDPDITQDRIEDILNAFADPMPIIQYQRVSWEGGVAGVIEIIRELHKLPYTIKANITSKILAGDVYVRHGSRTVKLNADDRELQDIIDEGNRAKLS